MSDYNGWTNKETWLVNLWYMDDMPHYFATTDQYHVEPNELEECVTNVCEECELLSLELKAGLISDFLSSSWARVNWHELADTLNETLAEMEEDNDSIEF